MRRLRRFSCVIATTVAALALVPSPARGQYGPRAGTGSRRPRLAYNPVESQRRYLNHVAGFDHVPGFNAVDRRQLVSPYQAYMDHVAGLDHVYHRR